MKLSTSLSALLVSGVLACSTSAFAVPVSISGSGAGFSGTGTLTATYQDGTNGEYLINGIHAKIPPFPTTLFAPGGFDGNDNLLFPNSTQYVDGSGFAFSVMLPTGNPLQPTETDDVDIYWNGSAYFAYILEGDGDIDNIPVTFNLGPGVSASSIQSDFATQSLDSTTFGFAIQPAATPEPSSLALLGTGIAGLFAVARRRIQARV
jgi:hypothetical protein